MWKQPYTIKEGITIPSGLIIVGLMLQFVIGPISWDLLVWPVNFILLLVFIMTLIVLYCLRKKVYFCRFMTTMSAAVPSIFAVVLLTLIMGLTRQVAEDKSPTDILGFSKMLSCWPFVLAYIWMVAIVGEVAIKQIANFKKRMIPSLTSHLGLFMVLTCGVLGSADMQRLKMYCETGNPEWRGLDRNNNVIELPLAIQLKKFTIDEYPAKLAMVDASGKAYPDMQGWTIRTIKKFENALPADLAKMNSAMPEGMMNNIRMDSLGMANNKGGFIETSVPGSATAWYVQAVKGNVKKTGWVSTGSYMFPFAAIQLDNNHILFMPERAPRKYSSRVNVYTKSGDNIETTIEVNKPFSYQGWKVYQLSYNEQMGKWSNLSVFELVTDPWLPYVYIGIFLLFIGALGMAFKGKKAKE